MKRACLSGFYHNGVSIIGKKYSTLQIVRLPRTELLKHARNWVLFTAFDLLFDPIPGGFISNLNYHLPFITYFAAYYYLLSLFLFPSFSDGSVIQLFILLILIYLSFAITECIITHDNIKSGKYTVAFQFFDALLIFIQLCLASYSSYSNRKALDKIHVLDELEKSTIEMEQSSFVIFLNSQMTDKFFDLIRCEVWGSQNGVARSIDLFKQIALYSFNTKPDEHILLASEFEYLESYISLQKCIHKDVCINISTSGDLCHKTISPRIMIAFIENAFKHGVVADPEHPIKIWLQALNDRIILSVQNQKKLIQKKGSFGLGIKNAKQALVLFYPEKHDLRIEDQPHSYAIVLTLII